MATARKKAPAAINAEQLATFSDMVSRMEFATRFGLQYDGDRDLMRVGGYPKELTYQHFNDLYERDGVAGQIVDMPPETTWRNPPEVLEVRERASVSKKDATQFERAWTDLVDRLGIWRRLERADRLSRIGRYSILVIGSGGDDGNMVRPLQRLSGPEAVLYLSAYPESLAEIDAWVTNPGDPRFGQPEVYKVDLSSGVATFQPQGGAGNSILVHHSRVVHVAEGLLADEVFGRPALKRVYNDLHDLQKISTSTAEAFWQIVSGVLTAKIDPEAQVSPEQLEALDEALVKLYHDLQRTFYGRGIDLERLAGEAPDPEKAAALYMARIASGAGIPRRMLFGSETGERASTEDQKTYLGSIAERQNQHAEPAILRPLIDRLTEHGALPRPGREGYDVVWPPLFEESELEMAEANRARAQAAQALTAMGGDPMTLVEVDAERNVWLRPTGERGELTREELEPELPELPELPEGPEGAEEPEEPEEE